MTGWLPRPPEELFGAGATASQAYELLTVEVPAERWTEALTAARDELGCTYFDWLSAVDEPGAGLAVCAHLAALGTPVRRLLLRTTVPHGAPELPTATGVYAGAAWHERETHEMFGVVFTGHPGLTPLLLPDGFEGHPLRKDFVLAARVAKAWPGAKEPGESGAGGPKRRQALPPGVPDPNEWGPLKGQLPPGPARPARRRAASATGTAGGTGEPGAPGERRPRRARSASAGSASQRAAAAEAAGTTAGEPVAGEGAAPAELPARPPRRARSAAEGSASQRAAAEPGRRSTDAPWLKPSPGTPAPEETSDEAARRVRETDEQAGTPLAEGGGASVANAPGDAPGSAGEAGTRSDSGTGGTNEEAGTDTGTDTGTDRDGTTGGGT
ncbi:NADH-quinone oxidoreductase subunit C [Streptomyces sp. TRM 70361]|uniref:NADH-quinone oxidoreductase subunit C n=1 Tax=Streptomyces sp. TRM 70361 TaxID=3116553 RepID=UPI002E7ACA25|nr:NADH-quinone oxidoreductase subunit C [Streptomyces sp. TRM 70361]MEE1940473.1 NADH-quinone oxidoreductase subunit C [Streptomyces sp. TRM 70361]